jgi:hypothetical protein
MSDEHDDDLEPEVDVGAEIETQDYAGLDEDAVDAADILDGESLSAPDRSGRADDGEQSSDEPDEGDASDTI